MLEVTFSRRMVFDPLPQRVSESMGTSPPLIPFSSNLSILPPFLIFFQIYDADFFPLTSIIFNVPDANAMTSEIPVELSTFTGSGRRTVCCDLDSLFFVR